LTRPQKFKKTPYWMHGVFLFPLPGRFRYPGGKVLHVAMASAEYEIHATAISHEHNYSDEMRQPRQRLSNSPFLTPPRNAVHSSGVNCRTGPDWSRLLRTPM